MKGTKSLSIIGGQLMVKRTRVRSCQLVTTIPHVSRNSVPAPRMTHRGAILARNESTGNTIFVASTAWFDGGPGRQRFSLRVSPTPDPPLRLADPPGDAPNPALLFRMRCFPGPGTDGVVVIGAPRTGKIRRDLGLRE
jgi:hypothetical protein